MTEGSNVEEPAPPATDSAQSSGGPSYNTPPASGEYSNLQTSNELGKMPAWAMEGSAAEEMPARGGGGGGSGGGGFDFNKPRAAQQPPPPQRRQQQQQQQQQQQEDDSHQPAWMREQSAGQPALEGLGGADSGDDDDFFDGDASRSLLGGSGGDAGGGSSGGKKGCCARLQSWCGKALTSTLLLLTMVVSWALVVLAFVSSCPLQRSERGYREALLLLSGVFSFGALWDFRQKKCKRFKWRMLWIALGFATGVGMVAIMSVDADEVVQHGEECYEPEVPVDVIPVGDSLLVAAWVLIEMVLCKSKKGK